MRTYGQFCPIAKASEILAERWTLLIVRELLLGSHRFNELEWGLPHIPRSLLTQRLRALEDAGVLERKADSGGKRREYHLTTAGLELFEIIKAIGDWGQKWVNHNIGPGDVDPKLLVWDMHRRLDLEQLPDHRVVVQLDFHGAAKGVYWLVVERPDPSVCQTDPGFDLDLFVSVDTIALHRVWMGQTTIYEAIDDGLVEFDGLPELARAFPKWLQLSFFAGVQPVHANVAG